MRPRVVSHKVINFQMAQEVALHLMCETKLRALWMYPMKHRHPEGWWVVFIIPYEQEQA